MHSWNLQNVLSNITTDITYLDLYHTTKYLPPYALPAGLPSTTDVAAASSHQHHRIIPRRSGERDQGEPTELAPGRPSTASSNLPLPATTPGPVEPNYEKTEHLDVSSKPRTSGNSITKASGSLADPDEILRPARLPPKYSLLDFFPFSLLVNFLRRRGKNVGGKKAALKQARLHHHAVTHNIPLEISLYIVRFLF